MKKIFKIMLMGIFVAFAQQVNAEQNLNITPNILNTNTKENQSSKLNAMKVSATPETNATESEHVEVVIETESTPYKIALQNNMTVAELDAMNGGKLKGVEIISAGEKILLPANSLMAKIAQPKEAIYKEDNVNLPSLPSAANEEKNELLQELINRVPGSNYLENDAEKNTAILAQKAAEEDWDNVDPEEILNNAVEEAEVWAETYAQRKIDEAKNNALGKVNEAINKPINDLLGRFGNAQFSVSVDEEGNISASDFSLFSPIYDVNQDLVFGQVGVHEQGAGEDERLIGNFGLGYRYDTDDYLIGGNVFIDHDFTGSNTRLGFGGEYWRDYLKLAANVYNPLTGWKESDVLLDFEERAAKGFDIRAQGYLPNYPQLGGSLNFEQYFGDEVAYFGLKERQKDPYAITAGLDYTPIPLITNKAAYTIGKDGKDQFEYTMDVNLQLGTPIEQQLDASRVADLRTLKGSRYDMVDRNYDIVFEYRAQKIEVVIATTTPTLNLSLNQIAQLKEVSNNAKSNIVKRVWQRTSPSGVVSIVSDTNQSILSDDFDGVPLPAGIYKYQLIVETETGAQGISNVVSVEVLTNAAQLIHLTQNENVFYTEKELWGVLDDFLKGAPIPEIYFHKFEYITGDLEFSETDAHKLAYTLKEDSGNSINFSNEIQLYTIENLPEDFLNEPYNDDIVGLIVPDGTEEQTRFNKWMIYLLSTTDDVTLQQNNFSVRVSSIKSELAGASVTSNIVNEVIFKSVQSIDEIAEINYEIQTHIVDLNNYGGMVPSSSMRILNNYEELGNFEDDICVSIAESTQEGKIAHKEIEQIISTSTYVISKVEGLPSTHAYIESLRKDKSDIKVNGTYGVCIILAKQILKQESGEEIEVEKTPQEMVLNGFMHHSIVWQYYADKDNPFEPISDYLNTSNINITFPSDIQVLSEEDSGYELIYNSLKLYEGLEGCRARTVFRTQQTNLINNEYSWGELANINKDNEVKLTEQGLQLNVTFDYQQFVNGFNVREALAEEGKPLKKVCEDFSELKGNGLNEIFLEIFSSEITIIPDRSREPFDRVAYKEEWH